MKNLFKIKIDFAEEFENYSVEELEEFAIQAFEQELVSHPENYEEQIKAALNVRRRKLNDEFEWTAENKEKLLQLNDKLMECFEKLKIEALAVLQACNKRIEAKDDFLHDFEIEGYVRPYICEYHPNGKFYVKDGIEEVLVNYWQEWCLQFSASNIKEINNDCLFNREFNWNIELLDGHFNDHYISYAMHALCTHNYQWSLQDILKINHLDAELRVSYQHSKDIKKEY